MSGAGARRVFLGWDRPPMAAAGDEVARLSPPSGPLDLSGVFVVTPGRRAGRALQRRLLEIADEQGRVLLTPRIGTPSDLMGALLPGAAPAAGALTRWWAWAAAARSLDEADLRRLLPSPPGDDDPLAWLGLGRALDEALRELAAEGWTFRAAAERARAAARFTDADRWEVLPGVEEALERRLGAAGLAHPDLARVAACAAGPPAMEETRAVVLACVAELPGLARRALARAAEAAAVLALVPAPQTQAARFDDWGCPTGEWARVPLAIADDQVRIVDGPADQADAALEAVEEFGASALAADEVVFAVPDAEVTPHLVRRGSLAGVRVRAAAGTPLAQSRPARLLAAAAEFLRTRSFHAMGTLARHADAEGFVSARLGVAGGLWMAAMDEYAEEHVPARADGPWLPTPRRPSREGDTPADPSGGLPARAAEVVAALLGDLGREGRRPGGEWVGAVLGLLDRASRGTALSLDDPGGAALAHALETLRDRAAELGCPGATPDLSAEEAVRCVLALGEGDSTPPAPDPDAAEAVGWLEAPFDGARLVVVTGVNEGSLPRAEPPGPVLSAGVRAALGLPGGEARAARDSFLLSLLLRGRAGVRLIAGRRAEDGRPLPPSRLLLRGGRESLAQRVLAWAPPPGAPAWSPRRPPLHAEAAGARPSGFAPMPVVPDAAEPDSLSVTDFGAYLRSPYRYYLERRLRLREVAEEPAELDRLAFGDLLHEVLRRFAEGPERDAIDAARIDRFVAGELDRVVRERHGAAPAAAVAIQAAQARERLRSFARWQAARAAEGWRIHRAEWQPPEPPALEVDGRPVALIGRIDRIDRHEDLGWRLLDYKTGDKGKSPEKTHRRGGRWLDLQLPLYRLLARALTGEGAVQLGYVLLSASERGADLSLAEWDLATLDEAVEEARRVARRIRAGEFRDAGPFPPAEGTLAAISGTMHTPVESEDGPGGEGEGEGEGGEDDGGDGDA